MPVTNVIHRTLRAGGGACTVIAVAHITAPHCGGEQWRVHVTHRQHSKADWITESFGAYFAENLALMEAERRVTRLINDRGYAVTTDLSGESAARSAVILTGDETQRPSTRGGLFKAAHDALSRAARPFAFDLSANDEWSLA